MSGNILLKKGLVVAVILLFVSVSVIPSTGTVVEKKFSMLTNYDGNTLYVGGDGSGNYTRIQDAIDNASDGDTVFVYDDSSPYYENVIVHKAINLVGEDATTTIIDGMHIDDPLWINTSSVDIYDFTVTNSPIDGWSQGICVIDKKWGPYITLTDITISGCIVEGNNGGIRLDNTRNVEIAECIIRNNFCNSVYNIYSSHVHIHHCVIEENGNEANSRSGGIAICKNPNLGNSEYIEIFNCTITGNVFAGISISGGSSQVNVHHNEICGNPEKGIFVSSSSAPIHNVSIQDNDIFGNREGICLQGSDSVSIEKNQISSNTRGVYFLRSSGNIFYGNVIADNTEGICFYDTSINNKITRNNFIDNDKHVFYKNCFKNKYDENYWDNWIGLKNPLFSWFPKVVIGRYGPIPWPNFDWHPAREPYAFQ